MNPGRGCASGFWQSVGSGVTRTVRIGPAPEVPMTAPDLDAMTPLQRTIVERALALARELEATAGSAPDGQVIDRCESLLLGAGREFLRVALEDTLRARIEA